MRIAKVQAATWAMVVGLGLASGTGCQVEVGGQTLPSPWYQKDDIQYHPPGPEFKLSNEAAAQQAFQEQQEQVAE